MKTHLNFNAPFDEAVEFWRGKGVNLPTDTWRDIWQSQHDNAFVVAGVTNAELLADIKELMRQAIEEGLPFKTFAQNFHQIASDRGWTTWDDYSNAQKAWRIQTIYNTNFRTAYAAGRHRRQIQSGVPYLVYRHSDFVLNPRIAHEELDGLCLPTDHSFWNTHYPPNGWGCQCYVQGALKQKNGTLEENEALAANAAPPEKGWNYAPGQSLVDKGFLEKKIQNIPALFAATLFKWLASKSENLKNWLTKKGLYP